MKYALFAVSCVLAGGCAAQSSTADVDAQELRAAAKADDLTPTCEEFGFEAGCDLCVPEVDGQQLWNFYDDGQCDTFCASPDPDCGPSCEQLDTEFADCIGRGTNFEFTQSDGTVSFNDHPVSEHEARLFCMSHLGLNEGESEGLRANACCQVGDFGYCGQREPEPTSLCETMSNAFMDCVGRGSNFHYVGSDGTESYNDHPMSRASAETSCLNQPDYTGFTYLDGDSLAVEAAACCGVDDYEFCAPGNNYPCTSEGWSADGSGSCDYDPTL